MNAGTSSTRLLRSGRNEEVGKKTLPVDKDLKPRKSKSASELLPGSSDTLSLRTNTTSLPQQVRTRSSSSDSTKISTKHHSESTLHTSTPVKGASREVPEENSAADVQVRSKTQTSQDGDTVNSKKSPSLRSAIVTAKTTSPVSTRSRSVVTFSPEMFDWGHRTSKKAGIRTYERKHRTRTTNNLQSTVSSQHLATTADVDGNPKKRGRPGTSDKMPDSPRSETGSAVSSVEESKLRPRKSNKSPRNRRDVAIQADSQSSAGSSRQLRNSRLQSASSSLVSTPSRRRNNAVVESCSTSAKTALTAKSSSQYDTCFESASSQLQDTEDTDDELNRLARLAHGSPQSTVIASSSEDENRTPKKSPTCYSTTSAELAVHASPFSSEKRNTRQTGATADYMSDGSLDSDSAVTAKRSRTVETEHAPESSRATNQLAVDDSKKKSASNTDSVAAVSSPQHSEVDHWKRSGAEVSSSQVEKSSTEPVAGPSGMVLRTRSQNTSKDKSQASGKN